MIRISQIDDKFSIYKENIVVLLGIGQGTNQIIDLMNHHRINVDFICDNNKNNFGKIFNGIQIISPIHLQELAKSKNRQNGGGERKIVVQIATNNIDNSISEQLKSIGINSIISFDECHKVLHVKSFLNIYKLDPTHPILTYVPNDQRHRYMRNQIKNLTKLTNETPVFITTLPKTGAMTLIKTFETNNILHLYTHSETCFISEYIDDYKNCKDNHNKKIKIITTVREPLSQNLSLLYQLIADYKNYPHLFHTAKNSDNFFKNGGDAQECLELIYSGNSNYSYINDINSPFYNIEIFMNIFSKHILDISKHPFDKQKGYTIIKEGNLEVFVYQLEKINEIITEMSNWIGSVPFDKWERENEASTKWISESYKQAQKEIKFPLDHFNKIYDNRWIKHFYSNDDIEKFKEKWKNNIKN